MRYKFDVKIKNPLDKEDFLCYNVSVKKGDTMRKNEQMKFYNLYTPWIERKPAWKEFLMKVFKPNEYKEYQEVLKRQEEERTQFINELNKSAQREYKKYLKTMSV